VGQEEMNKVCRARSGPRAGQRRYAFAFTSEAPWQCTWPPLRVSSTASTCSIPSYSCSSSSASVWR
jgi:hypothetical protein